MSCLSSKCCLWHSRTVELIQKESLLKALTFQNSTTLTPSHHLTISPSSARARLSPQPAPHLRGYSQAPRLREVLATRTLRREGRGRGGGRGGGVMYSGRAAGAPFDRGRRQFFCCTRRGTFIFRVFYVFYALAPSLSFRYALTRAQPALLFSCRRQVLTSACACVWEGAGGLKHRGTHVGFARKLLLPEPDADTHAFQD